MPEVFSKAIIPFTTHLEEVRDCVLYIRESIRVKSVLGKIINWKSGKTYEISLANSFMKLIPPELRPVFNGLFVTVIAAFEEFLRSIITLAARQKVGQSETFGDLGIPFINRHMQYSGRLLATVHSPPSHLSIDYYDLCRRLGTCVPTSTAFEINETALSIVPGITELDTFLECLKSLGFPFEWDDFGRDKDLQKFFQTDSTRETSKELKQAIKDAVRIRHKIAHSGQSLNEITSEIFTQQLELLKLTAHGIVKHLNTILTAAA